MSAITMKKSPAGCFRIMIEAILMLTVCSVLQVMHLQLVCAEKAAACIETERRALLQFKAALVDDHGMLSSWGTEDNHKPNCCQWERVTCSNLTGHVQRLDLHGINNYRIIGSRAEYIELSYLSGEIHTSLMELQQLQYLNLSWNQFRDSHIPEFFGSMTNLRYLDLSSCYFVGKIPSRFGTLSHLKYLNLGSNRLEGSIPYQLGNLSKLQYLDLRYNDLVGTIPSQLGNLSSLHELYLGGNGGYDGRELKIDGESRWLSSVTSLTHLDLSGVLNLNTSHSWLQMIGKLPQLRELMLADCSLSDHFIPSLYPSKFNFSTSLSVLDLSWNTFTLPIVSRWVSNISFNLVDLDLSGNLLDSSTSKDFGSAMISHHHFSHVLHHNNSQSWVEMIGKLPTLRKLRLFDCNLSDYFLLSLIPSKFNFSASLSVFDLSRNSFTSPMIFQWVSNISPNLVELDLSENLLEGNGTNHFGTMMSSLEELDLSDNRLKGGDLKSFMNTCTLRSLYVGGNNLDEDLLSIIHNLSAGCVRHSLQALDLSVNQITGKLPDFSMFPSLKTLDLSQNRLSGKIPEETKLPPKLESLLIQSNSLEGGILISFGNTCTLDSLDLSNNSLSEELPMIIHHLSGCARYSLKELILGMNQINGTLPDLSMFNALKTLDLSENQLNGKIPKESRLPSQLESLFIQSNSLEGGIPKSFGNTCSLGSLDLSNNSLSEELPMIIQNLSGCARYSLKELHLVMNQVNGTLPDLSMLSTLRALDLYENKLNGKIPEKSRLPPQLESLSIQSNLLEGGIPKSFGNTCTLRSLDFSYNNLSDELQVITHNLSGCARFSLEEVRLEVNQIHGSMVDFSMFPSLEIVDLSKNKLNGKIPQDIQFPSLLETLDVSSNCLEGVITELHFANKSRLTFLDLSDNSVALVFNQNRAPPFQLKYIRLRSCKLGPHFPKWLQTQHQFHTLDISNAGISDIVPEWFWAKLGLQEFASINISYNNLKGTIPNLTLRNSYYFLTLASNQFEGPIPAFLRGAFSLDLSKNKFSASHSFLCTNGTSETLSQLDLSNNQLSGQIPNCWSHFKSLAYLDLSHNNFSGMIPASMGSLLELQALILRNNNLSEGIPSSMMNCMKLVMLDVRENKLSGHIPSWIGNRLQELQILSLQRNHLFGSLPLQLCYLRNIQFMDLSINNISRQIPKCINNLTSMAQKNFSSESSGHFYYANASSNSVYEDIVLNAFLMWKGAEQMFENKQLLLLRSIDLSSNELSGEIPKEIGNLLELVSLNLSRNNLTGKIPSNVGKLTSLEFLDLSRNQLSGSIPSSLTQIDRLTMLDVSHNHLSGEIPTGTQLQSFNASSYEYNVDLCGRPLEKLCIGEDPPQEPTIKFHEDKHSAFAHAFYMSMAFGFAVGFWGVFGSILVKRSWRHAYFRFLNNLMDNIYVMVTLKVAKYKRGFKG